MAICIAGMHRSGTSLVARLLQDSGLYLGPEEELGFDVKSGERHWENIRFVALNEKILNRLGGSWNNPPTFPPGWPFKPEIESLTLPAKKLIAMLSRDHPFWGWKDPRNSLTLRFWRNLTTELRVVVCVRNPVEVAHSLETRGDSIAPGVFRLWLTYYRELLAAVPPERRVLTHYEAYFQDPSAELRRVANTIQLAQSQNAIDDACASVSDNLRHHHAKTDEFAAMNVPTEVRDLYRDLCNEAQFVYPEKSEFETGYRSQLPH